MARIVIHVDASGSLDRRPPIAGLDYPNHFTSEDVRARNLVGSDALMVGAPVQAAGYMITTGLVNYIDSLLTDDTEALTFVSLARAAVMPTATSNSCLFVGNYLGNGEANAGANIFVPGNAPNPLIGSFYTTALQQRNFTGGTPATEWAIRALRLSEGQAIVDDLTLGIRIVTPHTGARSLLNRVPFRIGSGGGSFGGVSHVASSAIARRAVSDADLATLAQAMRDVAATNGIVV